MENKKEDKELIEKELMEKCLKKLYEFDEKTYIKKNVFDDFFYMIFGTYLTTKEMIVTTIVLFCLIMLLILGSLL